MSQIYKSAAGGGGVVTSVTGTNGVIASPTTGAVVVSGVNATTSSVGVASFNPAEFTVTVGGQVSLIGGAAPIDSIAVQSGTSPIVGDGTGLVTFNGAVVAAGTNPVISNGTGPNTYQLQVQLSSANLVSDATRVGLSLFNSAEFTVDINGFVSLVGNAAAIEKINMQTGTTPIVPVGGVISLNGSVVSAGTNPVRTDGTGANTGAVEVQISQAIAATDATKIGLSNYNSANFTVDSNGYVSIAGSGMPWTDVTGATQLLVINNGYLTDRGAGVVYTLPATATIGDNIKIDGKLGFTTITPNANQQILMGANSGTVGATGTLVATNVGDCVSLRCTTSGASTIWRVESWVGNWTLN